MCIYIADSANIGHIPAPCGTDKVQGYPCNYKCRKNAGILSRSTFVGLFALEEIRRDVVELVINT